MSLNEKSQKQLKFCLQYRDYHRSDSKENASNDKGVLTYLAAQWVPTMSTTALNQYEPSRPPLLSPTPPLPLKPLCFPAESRHHP